MNESQLQDLIRLELGRDGDVLLYRNNCGVAEMRGGFKVRFGVGSPGGSDLIGLYKGRALFVEIKTETGRQSPEQKTFQQCVERHGGIYRILRSVDDARSFLAELRQWP